ncbi:MAG: hypothetical protein E2581_08045 [Pseudomonas sp.]|nr:hypothetical protein [Pseudomonas sp.]
MRRYRSVDEIQSTCGVCRTSKTRNCTPIDGNQEASR